METSTTPAPIKPMRLAFVIVVLCLIISWVFFAFKNSQRMTPQKYASIVTEDKGVLVCFSPKPIQVGQLMHHEGRLWLVTKVTLQNTDSYLGYYRNYYAAHPGPRTEYGGAVMIEAVMPEPNGRMPEYFAVFGLPADGP